MRELLLLMLIPFLHIYNVQGAKSLVVDHALPSDPAKQPLVLLDGEQIVDSEWMWNIDPNTICELKIVKRKESTTYVNKYGKLAKNGIVLISTKGFVAKEYYSSFSKYNTMVKDQLNNPNFDYKEYRVFLNDELLNNENLNTWRLLFEN